MGTKGGRARPGGPSQQRGKQRRDGQQPAPSQRYPHNRPPGGRRPMPQRTPAQQARLWVISLCGAVPGAVVVYLTGSYWVGAAVFLAVVVVLGLGVRLYEKRKQQ